VQAVSVASMVAITTKLVRVRMGPECPDARRTVVW
jgi:hypothetical protein